MDPGSSSGRARELEKAGRTVVYVARNGKVLGLISITYEAQDDLQALMKTLRRDGVKQFHLISGDNARVVAALAGPLHFDGYRGNLRPEEKALYVEELVASGHTVAFIGDGVNDAPALSKASVGVAMGAAGSEAAIAAADIALADDNLMGLILVRRLSRQTVRVIHQNYWLALGTDLAGSVLALAGFLTPFLGGLLHIGHAAAIAANSGRLLTWQLPAEPEPVRLRRGGAAGRGPAPDCCEHRRRGLQTANRRPRGSPPAGARPATWSFCRNARIWPRRTDHLSVHPWTR